MLARIALRREAALARKKKQTAALSAVATSVETQNEAGVRGRGPGAGVAGPGPGRSQSQLSVPPSSSAAQAPSSASGAASVHSAPTTKSAAASASGAPAAPASRGGGRARSTRGAASGAHGRGSVGGDAMLPVVSLGRYAPASEAAEENVRMLKELDFDLSELAYNCPLDEFLSNMFLSDPNIEHRGIVNLGGTCFAAAAAQVLLRIDPVFKVLVAHKRACAGPRHCVVCAAYRQACALRSLTQNGSDLAEAARSPCCFNGKYVDLSQAGNPATQYDARDFLDDVLLQIVRQESLLLNALPADFEVQYGRRSVLDAYVLSSLWRRRRRCPACQGVLDVLSEKQCVILPLDKVQGTSFNLIWASLFLGWFEPTAICGACGSAGVQYQDFLEREPPVLFVSLQRSYQRGVRLMKDNRQISFPLRLPLRTGEYDLCGLVLHRGGGPQSGHYRAVCRTSAHAYHMFDDSSSRVFLEAEFGRAEIRREVYIMVYVRRTGGRPSGHHHTPYERGSATESLLGDSFVPQGDRCSAAAAAPTQSAPDGRCVVSAAASSSSPPPSRVDSLSQSFAELGLEGSACASSPSSAMPAVTRQFSQVTLREAAAASDVAVVERAAERRALKRECRTSVDVGVAPQPSQGDASVFLLSDED